MGRKAHRDGTSVAEGECVTMTGTSRFNRVRMNLRSLDHARRSGSTDACACVNATWTTSVMTRIVIARIIKKRDKKKVEEKINSF